VREFFPSGGQEDALKDIKRKLMIAGITASSVGLLFLTTASQQIATPQLSDPQKLPKTQG
jgi:hypothetical protein